MLPCIAVILTLPHDSAYIASDMQGPLAGILAILLVPFFLGPPRIHLRPAVYHTHIALIHSHMPQAAGAHNDWSGEPDASCEDDDFGAQRVKGNR